MTSYSASRANYFGSSILLDSQGANSSLQNLFKVPVLELLRYLGFQASTKTLEHIGNKMVLISQILLLFSSLRDLCNKIIKC